jgi:hypothetical protein
MIYPCDISIVLFSFLFACLVYLSFFFSMGSLIIERVYRSVGGLDVKSGRSIGFMGLMGFWMGSALPFDED